jgi:hypothetical protein
VAKAPETTESGYEVISFLVCDDVRIEVSGKEILIGVYNNVIIFPSFPSSAPSLIFRVSVSVFSLGKKKVIFNITDESSDSVVINSEINFDFNSQDSAYILGFGMKDHIFGRSTAFQPSITIDGDHKLLPRVLIRLPIGDLEAQRVAAQNT